MAMKKIRIRDNMETNINNLGNYHFLQKLKQLPFIDKILLYGSRARDDYKERSDIDLAIVCPRASNENWLEVLDIISNADTLLKIDCVRAETVSEKSSLKQAINKESIILYQKDTQSMTPKIQQTFTNLSKALVNLEIMLERPMDEDRANIDASIQRFEFSIELFWKLLKRIIEQLGKETSFPREVIQEAYSGKLIDDEKIWLKMLYDRNQISHTYDEALADQIYTAIKTEYYPVMRAALNQLIQKHPLLANLSNT
jgi:nucleotidyltransferase substrate binding protein (TIGR01987 family)